MPKLHWSEVAEADLDDIYEYIARDVPYYAEMFVDRLSRPPTSSKIIPGWGVRCPRPTTATMYAS